MPNDQDDLDKKQTVFKVEDGGGNGSDNNGTATGLSENIAGLLCYILTFITAIVFLVLEKDNKFIRYHALLSLSISIVLIIFFAVLSLIPILGWILTLILSPVVFILWLYLIWSAYQHRKTQIPIISDFVNDIINKK